MLKLNDEKGSTMLEYILVLPIIFLVLMLLIIMMFMGFEKAMLDSATQRGAIQASKMIVDPSYRAYIGSKQNTGDYLDFKDLTSFGVKNNFNDIQPYRYFFMEKSEIEALTKQKVKEYIGKTSFLYDEDDNQIDIKVKVNNYVVYTSIEVICTRPYKLPINIMGLELGSIDIVSRSYSVVNDPDEFIRNIDLAYEILEDVNIVGEGGKVEQVTSDAKEKISKMFGGVKDTLGRFFAK